MEEKIKEKWKQTQMNRSDKSDEKLTGLFWKQKL